MELWVGWIDNTEQYQLRLIYDNTVAVYFTDAIVYISILIKLIGIETIHLDGSLTDDQKHTIKEHFKNR